MNDRELLSAFERGDEQALDSIIKKYFPAVYGAAVRQLGDRHLAEDVAQSVFILFSRKAPSLSPDVSLVGWLLRATRFVARDVMKQRCRRLEREEQATRFAAATEEGESVWALVAPLVDEALATLSSREQQCVLARFIEGQSFREIGEQQSISEDAAQKRVSRSLEKMRLFLERRGVKTGAATFGVLLATNLVQRPDTELVEAAIHGVRAALHGQAAASSSTHLATAAAHTLRRTLILKLAGSSLAGLLVLGGATAVVLDRSGPVVPVSAAFQVSDSRIDVLATAWAKVAFRAAQLIRRFPVVPAPGDPRWPGFQQDLAAISRDGDAIRAAFLAAFPDGGSPPQLADFLTVELRETVGLSAKQQAAVFREVRNELIQGGAGGQMNRALVRDKTVVGTHIRSWLSPYQRRRFDYTYREDFLGLFTFAKLK
jgi:RNA polymerase sigma factor (sigma-70 family)